jgi:carboxymethylenebutenolidase
VGSYGGRIAALVDERPLCPLMLHFGRYDAHVPVEGVRLIQERHPQVEVHIYEAGHGFNCEERADFHAPSAGLARERALAFLRAHLAEG